MPALRMCLSPPPSRHSCACALEHPPPLPPLSLHGRQVCALKSSLQSVHEESSFLQLQVVQLQHSCRLLGGNLNGQLSLVQGGVVQDLGQEVRCRTQQLLEAQRECQDLQFQLQQACSQLDALETAGQAERWGTGREGRDRRRGAGRGEGQAERWGVCLRRWGPERGRDRQIGGGWSRGGREGRDRPRGVFLREACSSGWVCSVCMLRGVC